METILAQAAETSVWTICISDASACPALGLMALTPTRCVIACLFLASERPPQLVRWAIRILRIGPFVWGVDLGTFLGDRANFPSSALDESDNAKVPRRRANAPGPARKEALPCDPNVTASAPSPHRGSADSASAMRCA